MLNEFRFDFVRDFREKSGLRTLFVSGMVEEEFFAEAMMVHVDVDLSGGNVFVSEHFLYGTEVGSTFEEMRSK